jgi:hypothetical protein
MRRGLPHFIASYSASRDIWTRALPALTLLFLAEIAINAPNRDSSLLMDVLVVAVAFGVLLAGWAFVNRRRGRRSFARPDDVGPFEVGAFLVIPALVPLLAGSQVRDAVITAVFNVFLLFAIYFSTSYGLLAMTRWGLARLMQQLEAIMSLLARALPLLALLVTFLFLTAEVWQTAGALAGAPYWVAVLLFPVVGVVFLLSRLPRDVGELNHFEPGEIVPLVEGTPVEPVAADHAVDTAPPLGRREWGNVGLVALFSQGVQIFIVSLLIGVFFVLLGVLLVSEQTTESWAHQAHVLAHWSLGNSELVVTEELLRVAGFLTAFSGLNFTVVLVTDVNYRQEFRQEVVTELRQAFAVRAVYLDSVSRSSATVSST